jgi:DNA-binding response OmpR family regulator
VSQVVGGPATRTVDVLVVDDDDSVRASCAAVLQVSGFSVEVAPDGDVALEMLRELDVGVVLLDLKMPRRDGFAVLEELDDPPPVVLMSAFPFDDDVRARVGDKITNYLQKPVSPHRLVPVVAGILWNK